MELSVGSESSVTSETEQACLSLLVKTQFVFASEAALRLMVAAGVAAGVVRGVLSARRKNNTQADSATHLEPSAVGTTETSDGPRNQALVAGTAFGGKKSRRQVVSVCETAYQGDD